jgi:hypothetical protein
MNNPSGSLWLPTGAIDDVVPSLNQGRAISAKGVANLAVTSFPTQLSKPLLTCGFAVELSGFEPLTYSMRTRVLGDGTVI